MKINQNINVMNPISRKSFLKQSAALSVLPFFGMPNLSRNIHDPAFNEIVKANNEEVKKLLAGFKNEIVDVRRSLGFDFANITAAYIEPSSVYHSKDELVLVLNRILTFLVKNQNPDGTLDLGNLASPPDTAFIFEPICAAAFILKGNTSPVFKGTQALLKTFITQAAEGLRVGGVHTPNHRWVISAALARAHAVYPNQGYVDRIEQWLSEVVYMDADGHYLERSMIYAKVVNTSLLAIARVLNKPELFDLVRRNLSMTYYYMETNGDLVSFDSRRQDQFMQVNNLDYYLDYRYMAIKDQSGVFSAIATSIESVAGFNEKVLLELLFYYQEVPLYKQNLPKLKALDTNFERFFETTNLVRIRRGDTTSTIFGGTDQPLVIASGRSSSPNIFSFRKGEAILKYLRFSTSFFSTGYFRSQGIKKDGDTYVLSQKIEAPYYQPLPDNLKKADGDYTHSESTDGRFWNKMDFQNRPQSNVQHLETQILVKEKEGKHELEFKVDGTKGVYVTIELCFKEGGQLLGIKPIDGEGNFALEQSEGTYVYGKDKIKFGPGTFKHNRLRGIEGEKYTSHFGTLRTEGMHVFLTGITPFSHVLIIE